MAHFAKIGLNGKVLQVLSLENKLSGSLSFI